MARVFLSPSTQEHNAYYGGGNEETEMRDVTALIETILEDAGVTVRVGGTSSASINAVAGNVFGADVYVAIHSNAGGGLGTEVWYYTGSWRGQTLANSIYKRLAPVTHSPDRGVKHSSKYVELHTPNAPSVIIEIAFHDKAVDAEELRTHHSEHAQAIAAGILDHLGMSVPTSKPPVVVPPKTLAPMPVLRFGSSGKTVIVLQSALKRRGYRLVIDGDFGKKTRSAVRTFQASHFLLPDGVVGPKTWRKLGY
jgi:N-acetylmuramoyl-L-alanine amidase